MKRAYWIAVLPSEYFRIESIIRSEARFPFALCIMESFLTVYAVWVSVQFAIFLCGLQEIFRYRIIKK